jgi:transposase
METRKDILMMTQEEVRRLQIVRKVLDKGMNQQEAAEYLGLCDRQIRRIVCRVRKNGDRGVIHRLRGQSGPRRLDPGLKVRILGLYRKQYPDFGPTLASEKLLERDKIKICDETLRLWLIEARLWSARQKTNPKTRSWRERKHHLGEMVQMDGSHHDWLEGRGPKLVLMGYIDDATGRFYGRFHEYEGTHPAMESLGRYIRLYGLPKAVYLDKHSTYKNNQKQRYTDWPFRDQQELTQFERACRQLDIQVIHAHSPQAKGRVERVFKTHQDRLVKELRLQGAKTRQEANIVLGRYSTSFNRKFEVSAKDRTDWHRPLDPSIRLDEVLSVQTQHRLRNDRTIVHDRRWIQVLSKTRADQVTLYESPGGHVMLKGRNTRLSFKRIEGPIPKTLKPTKKRPRHGHPIAMNHPYKQQSYQRYLNRLKERVAA